MDADSASERLLVIRTLMERSAIYRRALAPIMLFLGTLGLIASVAGTLAGISTPRAFTGYWMLVAGGGLAGAFFLVRRQALKDREPFWSPPTRRVAMALLPLIFVGAILGIIMASILREHPAFSWVMPVTWIFIYGCAIHAAGFFMPRGIKLLGLLFILGGAAMTLSSLAVSPALPINSSHVMMGVFFGGLHLAYGVYLHFTEKA